jgi:hypothetical protein
MCYLMQPLVCTAGLCPPWVICSLSDTRCVVACEQGHAAAGIHADSVWLHLAPIIHPHIDFASTGFTCWRLHRTMPCRRHDTFVWYPRSRTPRSARPLLAAGITPHCPLLVGILAASSNKNTPPRACLEKPNAIIHSVCLTYFVKNNITVAYKHNLDVDNFYTKIVDFDYLPVEEEHLVRKLHTRLEVTSSNPRIAHAYISRENRVACDLGRALVRVPPGGFQIFFDVVVPPLVPIGITNIV